MLVEHTRPDRVPLLWREPLKEFSHPPLTVGDSQARERVLVQLDRTEADPFARADSTRPRRTLFASLLRAIVNSQTTAGACGR